MENIKIASAFVQGRGHIKKNIPCQDRTYSLINKKDNFYSVSLADGAGSCKYSHFGAEIVTRKILALVSENFLKLKSENNEKIKKFLISNLIIELDKYSKENNIPIKELASTLLFIAIKDKEYIAGHLGDGVIGFENTQNELSVISHPDNGEFSNSTYFVTHNDSYKHFRIFRGEIENIEGFIIMSDGAEESLYDKKNKTLSSVCSQMLDWLNNNSERKVEKALIYNLDNIIKTKTFDDCSIGLLKIEKDIIQIIFKSDLKRQKELLKSTNTKYVRNDIQILKAIFIGKCKSIKEIVSLSKVRPKTVKRHLENLNKRNLIDNLKIFD